MSKETGNHDDGAGFLSLNQAVRDVPKGILTTVCNPYATPITNRLYLLLDMPFGTCRTAGLRGHQRRDNSSNTFFVF